MKKSTTSIAIRVALRAVIATTLGICLITSTQPRVSATEAAAVNTIEGESQFRSEASLYERAIRDIAGIQTMKLDTADDLKQAITILDRSRPNMKFLFSKLVVMAITNSTFVSAVKKRAPDKASAEAFAKELSADPKSTLKLDGSESLRVRMQQSRDADAATMRKSAERLKGASEKIRKAARAGASQSTADGFKMMRVSFNAEKQPAAEPTFLTPHPTEGALGLIVMALFIAAVVVIAVDVFKFLATIANNVGTTDGREAVAECQANADTVYNRCVAGANRTFPPSGLTLPLNLAAIAVCYSQWLIDAGECIITPH